MLTDEERDFLAGLYKDYYHLLRCYSYSLLDKRKEYWPLSEDCAQMTFLKATVKVCILRQHIEPYLWLMKTCQNITLSEKRKLINRGRILNNPISIDGQIDPIDPNDMISEWMLSDDMSFKKQKLKDSLTEQELIVYEAIYEKHRCSRYTYDPHTR